MTDQRPTRLQLGELEDAILRVLDAHKSAMRCARADETIGDAVSDDVLEKCQDIMASIDHLAKVYRYDDERYAFGLAEWLEHVDREPGTTH